MEDPIAAALAYCATYQTGFGLDRCGERACIKCFGRHGSGWPWKCSREPGHTNDHVAIDNDGETVIAQWSNES